MEFLITEKQLAKILLEEKDNSLENSMKTLYNFTKEMVSKVSRIYGVNLRMFLTWGTSVGGLMLPLDNFLKTGNFNLDENERMLILAGVTFALFFEGKRGMIKVLEKISEKGLDEEFNQTLSKGKELKFYFGEFVRTITTTGILMMEIIAYSFLLPIIPDFFHILDNSESVQKNAELITERLLASGVVLLSREILYSMVRRILNKIIR